MFGKTDTYLLDVGSPITNLLYRTKLANDINDKKQTYHFHSKQGYYTDTPDNLINHCKDIFGFKAVVSSKEKYKDNDEFYYDIFMEGEHCAAYITLKYWVNNGRHYEISFYADNESKCEKLNSYIEKNNFQT